MELLMKPEFSKITNLTRQSRANNFASSEVQSPDYETK